MLKEIIQKRAAEYANEFIEIRRHLHANPELSYQEFETSSYIQNILSSWGIPFQVLAVTGITGLIHGKNPESRVIALRADIDALPITEANDVPYKSRNEGVMHACGHDVHTACLLGAVKILHDLREEWEGTVKFIFQPGEEKNPGGANLMIAEGVLKNPVPHAIFGLHVHTGLPVGQYSFRGGMAMASADELYFTVRSKGGHAAAPHLTGDTVLSAAQLICNLQQLISRRNDPFNPSVLSITSIQGGNTTNVIPDTVNLMGTFRAMNEEWRFQAHDLIRTVAESTATLSGTQIDVHIDVGYPFVFNNENLSSTARQLAEEYAGASMVSETERRMGAEDFAYYSHLIPACFYRLGVANEAQGITSGVHTPTFNVDEHAIENGMGMMAWLAVSTPVDFQSGI